MTKETRIEVTNYYYCDCKGEQKCVQHSEEIVNEDHLFAPSWWKSTANAIIRLYAFLKEDATLYKGTGVVILDASFQVGTMFGRTGSTKQFIVKKLLRPHKYGGQEIEFGRTDGTPVNEYDVMGLKKGNKVFNRGYLYNNKTNQ